VSGKFTENKGCIIFSILLKAATLFRQKVLQLITSVKILFELGLDGQTP